MLKIFHGKRGNTCIQKIQVKLEIIKLPNLKVAVWHYFEPLTMLCDTASFKTTFNLFADDVMIKAYNIQHFNIANGWKGKTSFAVDIQC